MKKVLLLILGTALLLSFLAVGCGTTSEDPATKIDNAYKNALNYKTVHEEYELNLKVDGDVSALGEELAFLLPLDLTISGEGDVDNSDKDNPKMQMTMAIEGITEIIETALAASGGSGTEGMVDTSMFDSLFADMEIKLVDKVLYLKMMGEWYESDTGELASQATGETQEIDTSCTQKAMEEKLVPSAVLTNLEEVGSEDVDGESTTHYKSTLDLGKITDVSAEIARECDQADAAGALETGNTDIQEMFKTLDVELWIDGDDNVRKVTVNMELDTKALSGFQDVGMDADQTEALESLSIAMTMTLTQSGFDEDVNIEAPEDAKPMEDLLGGLSGLGGLGTGFDDVGSGFDDVGTTTDDDMGTSTTSSTTTNPFST